MGLQTYFCTIYRSGYGSGQLSKKKENFFLKIGCNEKNPWLLYINGRPGLYRKPYSKCKKKILQKQGNNTYFRMPVVTKDITYWTGSMGTTFLSRDLFSYKLNWKPIFVVFSSNCFISTFFLSRFFGGRRVVKWHHVPDVHNNKSRNVINTKNRWKD